MTPVDLFGVVVRTIGLLLLLFASWLLGWALLNIIGGGPGFAVGFVLGVPALISGVWFLRGADGIVSFAYGIGRDSGN